MVTVSHLCLVISVMVIASRSFVRWFLSWWSHLVPSLGDFGHDNSIPSILSDFGHDDCVPSVSGDFGHWDHIPSISGDFGHWDRVPSFLYVLGDFCHCDCVPSVLGDFNHGDRVSSVWWFRSLWPCPICFRWFRSLRPHPIHSFSLVISVMVIASHMFLSDFSHYDRVPFLPSV